MTLAEQRKVEVLRLRDEGLAEEEIAEQVGISEAAVMRILDREEPPPIPYREPVVTPKIPKVRSVHRLPFQAERLVPPDPSNAKKWRAPGGSRKEKTSAELKPLTLQERWAVGSNGLPTAEHGTESGYNKHTRHGEEPCDPCKEAIRLRAERRRHDARERFTSEQDAQVAASNTSKFAPKQVYHCDTCQGWHFIAIRKKLDTLQLTS